MIERNGGIGMGVARRAVTAGMALALALGGMPAMALAATGEANNPEAGEYANADHAAQVRGTSTGDTKLYVIARNDDLAAPEGSVGSQLKVTIPVAIHYVAESNGTLVGPSDDTVKFVNHTQRGAVHVSKITVENSGKAKIVKATEATTADKMSFGVTPVQGQSDGTGATFVRGTASSGNDTDYVKNGQPDELGNYVNGGGATQGKPVHDGEWNIAPNHGALGLNGLTGKVGGFDEVDPVTDYQAGIIHWTVRAGTRAEAEVRDDTVTIHYNANNGSNKDCAPVPDQPVRISGGGNDDLASGAKVVPPTALVGADGSVTEYEFKGWSTMAGDAAKIIEHLSELSNFDELGNGTIELYAIYGAKA